MSAVLSERSTAAVHRDFEAFRILRMNERSLKGAGMSIAALTVNAHRHRIVGLFAGGSGDHSYGLDGVRSRLTTLE